MATEYGDARKQDAESELEKIKQDIHLFLEEHRYKELLRFVAVGSVDDGKSTLIGRLLHDAGQVYEDQLEDARKGNTDEEQEIDFALLTDGLRAEREQGITIDVAYRYFHTKKRKFIIADTPGHVQYTRNMATGASTADVAIILIDARLGVQQQSKRHAYIASLLGIPHLTVCINKMDLKEYDAQVYQSIREDFEAFSASLSFQGIHFLPISAKFGDNVVGRSEHMPWYTGPTLLEHLEHVPIVHDPSQNAFRLPVQYVLRPHQDYRGFAGQIASGVVRQGDTITVMPSGKTSRIQSIDTFEGSIPEAFAPMSVTLCLEDEIDISRGDMIVQTEGLPIQTQVFEAMLVWMNEKPLSPTGSYLIKHTTQTVRAELKNVLWKSDPNTLDHVSTDQLELNEIGRVRFSTHRPIYFDPYADNRRTGAFILIDYLTNETLAAGMLQAAHQDEAIFDPKQSTLEEKWKHLHAHMWSNTTHSGDSIRLDVSTMQWRPQFIRDMEEPLKNALVEMQALESGSIANPDEQRMVGHYWLRTPQSAPTQTIRDAISQSLESIQNFANDVHSGVIQPERAQRFTQLLVVGIGGSALGPQWLDHAFTAHNAPMQAHFFDNTDPDGFIQTLEQIGEKLQETLVLIVSKSGGTLETRNGMLAARWAFEAQGLTWGRHAAVITGEGSRLAESAQTENMLGVFPMWDWVGGRTSVFSAVGLLPAALLGLDIQSFLSGAAEMDEWTRQMHWKDNPAAWMALSWYHATQGNSERAMALLPYKDRFLLLSRYMQQLLMESLGKQLDRSGTRVHQGLTVYGNKGSTDQHALVQQLREGPDDFFATFIEVLRDTEHNEHPLTTHTPEENIRHGDYLLGFLLGTREALRQSNRMFMTLTLPDASIESAGRLIALFERAVGLYASLLNINAYHQPGVEAGKQAASVYMQLQVQIVEWLQKHPTESYTVQQLAKALDAEEHTDALMYLVEHLAANGRLDATGELALRTYTLSNFTP